MHQRSCASRIAQTTCQHNISKHGYPFKAGMGFFRLDTLTAKRAVFYPIGLKQAFSKTAGPEEDDRVDDKNLT